MLGSRGVFVENHELRVVGSEVESYNCTSIKHLVSDFFFSASFGVQNVGLLARDAARNRDIACFGADVGKPIDVAVGKLAVNEMHFASVL